MEEEIIIPEEDKKKGTLKKVLIALGIFFILLLCYMLIWSHKWIRLKEIPIIYENLPSNFNGFKIIHFSDIHFGKTTNELEIEQIIEKINQTKPDIIVYTGDLLNNGINLSEKSIDFLKENLSKLNAKFKKYAIIGDNDYQNIELYQDIMNSAGFKILNNENELIFQEGNIPIQIAGIPSIQKETPDFSKTWKTDEEVGYKILLSHEPQIIEELEKTKPNLILSGHTLGGLIYIPWIGEILKKPNTGIYQKGMYQKNDITLIVSPGIGTENYPVRLGNPPTIYLYRLYNFY